MDRILFEWDEHKNTINKKNHGVSFEEAKTVFYDVDAILIDDPDHSEEEERLLLLGLSRKNESVDCVSLFARRRGNHTVDFGQKSDDK